MLFASGFTIIKPNEARVVTFFNSLLVVMTSEKESNPVINVGR